ncbi:hypothetical protein ACT7C9_23340 [Bacillus cereus]
MNTLFALLFVVCLIALIIGIIKPQLVVRWGEEGKRNRKSVLKFYGIGVIAMFVLVGVTADDTKKAEETKAVAKPAKAEQKKELTAEEKATTEQAAAEKATAEKATSRESNGGEGGEQNKRRQRKRRRRKRQKRKKSELDMKQELHMIN